MGHLDEVRPASGFDKELAKGPEAYKNSVTDDAVGDPFKEASGPVWNIGVKLSATIGLVFGGAGSCCRRAPANPPHALTEL